MKIRNTLAPLLVGAMIQTLNADAGDLYLVNLSGTCKTISQGQGLVSSPINTATIIRSCAGVANKAELRDVRLVYDVDADKLAVMRLSTGETLCDFVIYGEPSTAANFADTIRVRHVYLFHPDLPGGIGSLVMTERITRNQDDVATRIAMSGNFHYLIRASETNAPIMCTGSVSLGKKLELAGTAAEARR